MSIFNVDNPILAEQGMPPILRQPNENAWMTALTAQCQIDNNVFNDYLTGSTYPLYNVSSAYTASTRVIYTDDMVYENILASGAGITPEDTKYWLPINPNYIGAIERSSYNAIKLVYELALNREFRVPGFFPTVTLGIEPSLFTSGNTVIYIQNNMVYTNQMLMDNSGLYGNEYMTKNSIIQTNYMGNVYLGTNQYDYTIYVPNFIYTATTTNIIRNFADQLNPAGMAYNVIAY